MSKIFISYRRNDCQYQADKLHQALKPYVANPKTDIFIDVDDIPYGVDFADHLKRSVAQCQVLLALIGPDWLTANDPITGYRRLDDPDDFVRIEIATALAQGIPVVPVLLDGTGIPKESDLPLELKPLARRNGLPVSRASFDADVARLIKGLPIDVSVNRTQQSPDAKAPRRSYLLVILPLAVIATILVLQIGQYSLPSIPETEEIVQAGGSGDAADLSNASAEENSKLSSAVSLQAPKDVVSPERAKMIRDLQTSLATLGYYKDEIDGLPGPNTQRAAEAFGAAENIPAPNLATAPLAEIEPLSGSAWGAALKLSMQDPEYDYSWIVAPPPDPGFEQFSLGLQAYEKSDYGSAAIAWDRSCSGKFMAGCYNLGVLYQSGNGVSQDTTKARKLFRTACDGGYQSACDKLNSIQ